jgi:hypothetical protein
MKQYKGSINRWIKEFLNSYMGISELFLKYDGVMSLNHPRRGKKISSRLFFEKGPGGISRPGQRLTTSAWRGSCRALRPRVHKLCCRC